MKKLFDFYAAEDNHPLVASDGHRIEYLGRIQAHSCTTRRPNSHLVCVRRYDEKKELSRVYFVNDSGQPPEGAPIWQMQVYLEVPDEVAPTEFVPPDIDVRDLPFLCMVRDKGSQQCVHVRGFNPESKTIAVGGVWREISVLRINGSEWADARQPQREARWFKFEARDKTYPDPHERL